MNKVFIVAEAGVNHNGSMKTAREMIDAACAAGVDAVKFQTFTADSLVTGSAEKAEYQKAGIKKNESQHDMLKTLELDANKHKELIGYCRKKGVVFISSPFDIKSIDTLVGLGVSIIKIPSGEIINVPYLKKAGGAGKKIIISTGMADLDEVRYALNVLTNAGTPRKRITVLHCHTEYPTELKDVNLRAMDTIRKLLAVDVGYSDHTLGIEVPIAAAAMGASVIEKHFTLDRRMRGPDHRASIEPDELCDMVRAIRKIEIALGSGIKRPTGVELKNRVHARKSIVAARKIKEGDLFTEDNLSIKRPAGGISPIEWDSVLGMRAARDFKKDEAISL